MDRPSDDLVREALRVIADADPDAVHAALAKLAEQLGAVVAHTAGVPSVTVTKDGNTFHYALAGLAGGTGGASSVSGTLTVEPAEPAATIELSLELALVVLVFELCSMRIGELLAEGHEASDVTSGIIAALVALIAVITQARRKGSP